MVQIFFTEASVFVNTERMFQPGGDVFDWATARANEIKVRAIANAPPGRTRARHPTWARGHLQRSITAEVDAQPGRVVLFRVAANVPYAKFVHNGTAGGKNFIYTNDGWANRHDVDVWIRNRQFEGGTTELPSGELGTYFMPITRIPGRTQFALRVRGQRKNPFLTDGYNEVARRHSALPRL